MTKHRKQFMLIGGLVFVLAAILASSPAAWATPGQDHLRDTVPQPIPDPYIIVLPPQRDGSDYSFNLKLLPGVECPPPVGCEIMVPFMLEVYLGTQLIYPVTFDPPLEICFEYTEAQAASVGGADNLTLAYWDGVLLTWVPFDNWRADFDLMMVCGDISFVPNTICGLGVTCLVSPTGVPVTGQPDGPDPTAGYLLVAVVAMGVVIGGVALALRGRGSQGL